MPRGARTCRGRRGLEASTRSRGTRGAGPCDGAGGSAGGGRSRRRRCLRRRGSDFRARGPQWFGPCTRGCVRGSPVRRVRSGHSILSRMSTVEPFGTWQYAQAVCFPAGARVSSNRLCCARRTNGLRGPSVPGVVLGPEISACRPRWTVAASPTRGARQGIGAVERVVQLEHAGPVTPACEPPPVPRRQEVAADRDELARGEVAEDGALGGRSRSEVTCSPGLDLPPSSRSRVASASAIAWEPPLGNGQPSVCASARSTSAKEAVAGCSSGSVECAAGAGKDARAFAVSNRFATPRTERSALRPKRAAATGWCGTRRSGPSSSGSSVRQSSTASPSSRRYAGPSAPSSAAVSSTERWTSAADPSSNGCARTTGDGAS